ncbi:MAG: hypothetical protein ACI8UO_004895 [Verrucomicrobiales bacterium]|jgi:hypothetical protein
MHRATSILILFCASLVHGAELRVEPAESTLHGSGARQQLLVTALDGASEVDATRSAKFVSSNPAVATVDEHGVVRPVADGVATIAVSTEEASATARIVVRDGGEALPISFRHDVIPLLTREHCNSGGCHGKQAGRNGFKLSLFGYDPEFDHEALVKQARGRRVVSAAPDQSLVLMKATGEIAHGGGPRLARESAQYETLRSWIEAGGPLESERDEIILTGIEITPSSRVLSPDATQQVLITAAYSDGSRIDVTHLSSYTTNNEALGAVDEHGVFAAAGLGGEVAVMANFMGRVATFRVTIPMNEDSTDQTQLAAWRGRNYIDKLLAEKWADLNLAPSPTCDDATFVRRAYLDCIGRLPTPEEVETFLEDKQRSQLIADLIERPEYADFWAQKWADLLKINADDLGAKNAYLFDAWLRDAFRENMPYDQFVRQLITAQGNSFENRAANFYKAFTKPDDLTIAVSQVFLGIRLECAQCHHHPYEKWGQDDFYGLSAIFSRVARKKEPSGAELIYAGGKVDVKHPRTGEVVAPSALEAEPIELAPGVDRRVEFADWMTNANNRFVARTIVNRIWADFMGRGLVEPIDDMRVTNPASSEELLQALADDFVKNEFDIKYLIRTITASQAYGLSSIPNQFNVRDTSNYSRAYRKRLTAEVLLDAISDVTEAPEEFAGMPAGSRAVQLWNNRLPSSFLDVFGRPERKSVCECERSDESGLGHVLHLMNAPLVNDKIQSPTGRAARLAKSDTTPEDIITEFYLAALSRYPNEQEMTASRALFDSPESTRRTATEDVLWALLNTAEFVFNH